jgi:hypothetical protein
MTLQQLGEAIDSKQLQCTTALGIGLTDAALWSEFAVAVLLLLLPGALIVGRILCKGPLFPALESQSEVRAVRESAGVIASASLTLAGLTFAAVTLLATAESGFATSRQTPLGFFVFALLMYASSVVLAKWIRPWTVYILEQLRDTGTILLLIGIGFMLFEFPGTKVWIVIGFIPLLIALTFFLSDLWSTWKMIRDDHSTDK